MLPLFLLALAAAQDVDVFVSGEGGYHTYRIPAIVATNKGTLLAFCEGRRGSSSDAGDIDLLLRRSFDGGKNWGPVQVVADMGADTIGNPAPVVDRTTGDIVMLLTYNGGRITEKMIEEGQGDRTVWVVRSRDDGETWSAPVEITKQVKLPDWTWYATGPGNGIQLRKSGRLVVACDHTRRGTKVMHSHLVYSDDHGETWHIGAIADEQTNESAVAELRNGELVLNMRSYHRQGRRAVQRSNDGGLSLDKLQMDGTLVEPVCQGSLISIKGGRWLVFSNPASETKREKMTIRISKDKGRTWPYSELLFDGPSAYSSLVELKGRQVGLLYERGDKRPYERIRFTVLSVESIARKTQ